MITPELSLTGYPPEDLLFRSVFINAIENEMLSLAERLSDFEGLRVLVGHPFSDESGLQNRVSVIYKGEVILGYSKQKLPNSEVFDELRYFVPGNRPGIFEIDGTRFGVIICEDAWSPEPAMEAKKAGADIILISNASPYFIDKQNIRRDMLASRNKEIGLPIIYTNSVGGQDELIFDGASFAVDRAGQLVFQADQFRVADYEIICTDNDIQGSVINESPSLEGQVYKALCLGVKDYIEKNNFPGVIIGLSGGVDSALVLAVAVDALGAEKVRAVMMPSQYTADISIIDARKIAQNLSVEYDEISIVPMVDAFSASLKTHFYNSEEDATEENIQARIRGAILMALSNKTGRIVLTTGNKSEMAVGYCTLYGDMAGGFAVIKDVLKTLVYRLCQYRNNLEFVIPERVLTRAPSAELRSDQKDQDSLPEYAILDDLLIKYMEKNCSVDSIISEGYDAKIVNKIAGLVKNSEYKRRQSPVGIKVTKRAFGRDWRYPITNKFLEPL